MWVEMLDQMMVERKVEVMVAMTVVMMAVWMVE